MYSTHFYHGSIRKIMAVFGSIFTNITVERYDSDRNVIKTFQVPIAEAQQRSFLVKLRDETIKEGTPRIAVTLPRLSYEFSTITYRPEDKLQNTGYIRAPKTEGDSQAYKMYNPVPYDIGISLSLWTQNMDDSFQIIEQILPFFSPQIAVTINEIPEIGIKNDIKIKLDSVTPDIKYEGSLGVDRVLQWELKFTVSTYMFQPVAEAAVIKRTIENIYAHWNNPTQLDAILTQEVNPLTADKNDTYVIDETIEEF